MTSTRSAVISRRSSLDHKLYGIGLEVDAMLNGKDPDDTMHLFTNLGAAAVNPESYTPNTSLWCQSLRAQLTGVHMGAGSYAQSYGFSVLTPRHAITCTHGGPPAGTALWYVKADGTEIFKTSILRLHVITGTDITIALLEHECPSWVCKYPLIDIPQATWLRLIAQRIPVIGVSQGNITSGDARSLTPHNRKVYVGRYLINGQAYHQQIPETIPVALTDDPAFLARDTFWHFPAAGDSGCPIFLLANDTLHFIAQNGSGTFQATEETMLNTAFAAVDTAAGISTGYTVTVNPNPFA